MEALYVLGLIAALQAPLAEEFIPRITPEMRQMNSGEIKSWVQFYLPAEMMPIINCESHFRQYDNNGVVLRSQTNDVGVAQINVDYWGEKAKELGFDIYTPIGNLKMARYIYDIQGKAGWVCSKMV